MKFKGDSGKYEIKYGTRSVYFGDDFIYWRLQYVYFCA